MLTSQTTVIDVIIPAFNEENSVGKVIEQIPKSLVRHIIVCNNGSKDATRTNAIKHGAIVVDEIEKGYGAACLKGISYVSQLKAPPDIIVFLDADFSDFPTEMPLVVQPIIEEDYDLVIGSRTLGQKESGSMTPQQIFGNWLAITLIKLFYGYTFTDLGPFRAIKWNRLCTLEMKDRNFGWTVEMQVKAAKYKMKCTEVPVNYRRRIGKSKVSGTIKGTLAAGQKILWTIFKLL